jgi:hypothetical protein
LEADSFKNFLPKGYAGRERSPLGCRHVFPLGARNVGVDLDLGMGVRIAQVPTEVRHIFGTSLMTRTGRWGSAGLWTLYAK